MQSIFFFGKTKAILKKRIFTRSLARNSLDKIIQSHLIHISYDPETRSTKENAEAPEVVITARLGSTIFILYFSILGSLFFQLFKTLNSKRNFKQKN